MQYDLCSGLCTEQFEYNDDTPKIITSIARYHLYYHMMRFIRQPAKMSRYVTQDMLSLITRNKPTKGVWEDKFHQGQTELYTWLKTQNKSLVKDYHYAYNDSGNVVGIRYKKTIKTTIVGLDDYKNFIATKSNGLTKTGEKLLQQSAESYIYCVLGAQARTRWPIIGKGAKSLQTQDVFLKIVTDTVTQDDVTVTISNMRTAIRDTNVVLNIAISPGVILIPSNMIILKKMVAGFINVLTVAGSGMKFRKNDKVNYYGVSNTDTSGTKKDTEDIDNTENTVDADGTEDTLTHSDMHKRQSEYTHEDTPKPNTSYPSELYLLAITVISGSLVSRFVT